MSSSATSGWCPTTLAHDRRRCRRSGRRRRGRFRAARALRARRGRAAARSPMRMRTTFWSGRQLGCSLASAGRLRHRCCRSRPRRARTRAARPPRPAPPRSTACTTSCAMRSPRSSVAVACRIVVHQQHLHLAAIARVDEARRVQHGHAVPQREPRAREDEAREARRDRDGEAGADERARAGRDHDALGRVEIEARVGRARVARAAGRSRSRRLTAMRIAQWRSVRGF